MVYTISFTRIERKGQATANSLVFREDGVYDAVHERVSKEWRWIYIEELEGLDKFLVLISFQQLKTLIAESLTESAGTNSSPSSGSKLRMALLFIHLINYPEKGFNSRT